MTAIAKRSSQKPAMQERILQTAEALFYGEGIRATGVDTIAAKAGISKRTLYNHFPSKDALIAAYLKRGFYEPRSSDLPPLQQILRSFDRLEANFANKDFRGCRFVNAVAEIGDADCAARAIAIEFKEGRRLWFRDRLTALGVADADGLAMQLAILVDGAIAGAMVRGDPSVARQAAQAARVLIAGAGVDLAGAAGPDDTPAPNAPLHCKR
ncbi:TetR/AcrR family transcriptional regulator [Afipia sp. P52-10]|jgi:AcrR family transcriptional regulator|uniref:TetR/AcrR family transcriptional regulator n=1 Tax=Afipia sp. P52-10 TaxID=1429916 RepID=UPI0004B04BAA|nr:TetR/AcrR family transcriptional regulator [Afipia sp. P52-10]